MTSRENRVRGGLFGLLVGDALGVPYEFHLPNELPPEKEVEMDPPQDVRRSHNVPPGTWSDDGAQALCLLESILSNDGLNLEDFSQKLVAWETKGLWALDGYVFDVGGQTFDAIAALQSGVPPTESGFIHTEGKGNGALMRVLPLALWHRGDDAELAYDAHRQAIVTHGHLTNQVCCALYCLWARRLLQGSAQEQAYNEALRTLRDIYGDSEYRRELEETLLPDDEPFTTGGGYVVHTLNCARLALQEAGYERVVRRAISYGSDTDTNAAVAGGLAGIVYGVNGIPERWLKTLRGKELVEPLLQQLIDWNNGSI